MNCKRKMFFNQGEKGNVSIISLRRDATFADQTLWTLPNQYNEQQASVHVELNSVFFTPDGNPFFGGSSRFDAKEISLEEAKKDAIQFAEQQGFIFDPDAKNAFIKSPLC